jgi:peptidyl-tRNA hydrolase, PTH1 family
VLWKLVVGLGNPGKKYRDSRHNVGFRVLERFAERHALAWEDRFQADVCFLRRRGETVVLIRPRTYMNESGRAVQRVLSFYKGNTDNLLVVYDDMDLPLGRLRLRMKGGHGGHRGIASVAQLTGTSDIDRIRVGIGRPDQGDEVDFVLGRFKPDEAKMVDECVESAVDAVMTWIESGMQKAMNLHN